MIIPHFYNYPLLTKKYFDYAFFKEIVKLMLEKEHNTLQGIQKKLLIIKHQLIEVYLMS